MSPPSRSHKRGASRSSRTLGAGCGGRDSDARRATLKRTAKSCGSGAPKQALRPRRCSRVLRLTVATKQRSPRRARITRKTIAQGMPADPALPVVTAACVFCCRRAMGEVITRHSLRPLHFPRAKLFAALGRERVAGSRRCAHFNNNPHSGARVTRGARHERATMRNCASGNPWRHGFRACTPTGDRRPEHIPE